MTLASTRDPVAIAASYAEEVQSRRAEFDALRHLPQDIADRLARDGLYQICTPADFGGMGLSPRHYAATVEEMAKSDASVGWCIFIAVTSTFSLASAGTDAFREILREPGVIASGVFAPNGRARPATRDGVEGYVVTGRWQWGSGSGNAHWISGGAFIVGASGEIERNDAGAPLHLACVFDAADVEFIDTWTVMGLQGTGSTDYAVTDVFVPATRTIRRFGVRRETDPIFLFPNFGMLGIGVASVALGATRGAITDFLEFADKKVPQGQRRVLAEKQSVQWGIAKAEAQLRAGRAFFYEAIDAAWTGALAGEVTVEHRRDLRLATCEAVQAAKSAIAIVYELAGGTAVYHTSEIQRRMRDVQVAGQHMMVGPGIYELAGRLFLGLPTDIEQF